MRRCRTCLSLATLLFVLDLVSSYVIPTLLRSGFPVTSRSRRKSSLSSAINRRSFRSVPGEGDRRNISPFMPYGRSIISKYRWVMPSTGRKLGSELGVSVLESPMPFSHIASFSDIELKPSIFPPPAVTLTEEEIGLFSLLLSVVREERLGTTLRVAGGWVRDKLLGINPGIVHHKVDVDIALDNCLGKRFAERINNYLERHGSETHAFGVVSKNPEKSKHLETASMQLGGFWVDFVNLRTESYTCDSRIPEMTIGTPKEDAFRRDLTINALFYNINTNTIEDFTGRGLADLANRCVSTPLPAKTTLLDDPLRVLRSIRFASRFNFQIAPDLLAACESPQVHSALAQKVSYERIGVEIDLMVRSQDPLRAFTLIHELGLAPIVFALPGRMVGDNDKTFTPDVAFRQALVYLKNAHHLLQGQFMDNCVAAKSSACVDGKLAAEERRVALYAAFLLPFADARYLEKAKVYPVTKHLLSDMLKLPSRDTERVHLLHTAALELQVLLRRSAPSPLTRDNSSAFTPPRVDVGFALRKAGPLWKVALLLALTSDLGTRHILDNHVREDREEDAAVISAYLALGRAVESMGLVGCWEMKPLLDGSDALTLLPHLPRGPAFKEVMDEQIRWMLEHQGGRESDLRSHLLGRFQAYA